MIQPHSQPVLQPISLGYFTPATDQIPAAAQNARPPGLAPEIIVAPCIRTVGMARYSASALRPSTRYRLLSLRAARLWPAARPWSGLKGEWFTEGQGRQSLVLESIQ